MPTPVWPQQKLQLPAHPRFKRFDAFAAREIFPRLAELEAERRRVRRRALIIALGTVVIVPILVWLTSEYTDIHGFTGVVLFGVLPAIGGAVAASSTLLRFRVDLPDILLPKTCEHLGLRYTGTDSALPLHRFTEARLLPPFHDVKFWGGVESTGPDLVFTAAGTKLIPPPKPQDSDAAGFSHDYGTTIWRGLLVAVQAPRWFRGRTLVIAKRGRMSRLFDRVSGLFDDRADEERPKSVELGLGEREAGLEILATDPAEARQILTESVTRRLVELLRQLGREQASLGFIEDSALLAIQTDGTLFYAGSPAKPLGRVEILEQLLADYALIFELAEAFRDALGPRAPSPS